MINERPWAVNIEAEVTKTSTHTYTPQRSEGERLKMSDAVEYALDHFRMEHDLPDCHIKVLRVIVERNEPKEDSNT